jgi:phage virion morphogenesis protein
MAGASFKLDTSQFGRGVSRALAHFADRQRLAANIGEAMVAATRKRFRDEEGPDGAAWPKSRRAEEEGGQTLTDKATLKNSIGYEATPDTVAWGTNDIRAAAHQNGAEITPKKGRFLKFPGAGGKDVFVKKVTLPARPFVGFTEEDQAEAQAETAEFMREGFGL